MKKNFIWSILFILLLSITFGCQKPITYTEEFPYLPAMNNMELQSFTEAKEGDLSQAVYTVKNVSYEEVLDQYEDLLRNDGWSITQDQKPANLAAEKGDHIVIIVPQETESTVQIVILSK